MKKFLVAVALLACAGGAAFAGPNAGGTIFAHDANLVYTVDTASYCGLGVAPSSCEAADVEIDGATDAVNMVWKVYAAFCPPPHASPRLKGMAFGIYLDDPIRITHSGNCVGDMNNGGAELPGPAWPGDATGTAIVFQFTQTTQLVECYWFAGYNYYAVPGIFALGPHPDPVLGGVFADDSVPAIQDPIAGYGTLGFDVAGVTSCPTPQTCGELPTGACCIDEVCTITTEADCGGRWLGQDVPCEPNPCLATGACCIGVPPNAECIVTDRATCEGQGGTYMGDDVPCSTELCNPVPVRESTWGQIKSNYR